MDPPVASLVGVGQRVARDRPAHAHVVELVALRSQTDLDVAQTLPAGQLREGHAQELAHAGEGLRVSVSAISPNTFAESVHRQMFHHLRENELACIHDRRTPGRGGQHRPKPPGRSSRVVLRRQFELARRRHRSCRNLHDEVRHRIEFHDVRSRRARHRHLHPRRLRAVHSGSAAPSPPPASVRHPPTHVPDPPTGRSGPTSRRRPPAARSFPPHRGPSRPTPPASRQARPPSSRPAPP